MLEARKGEPTPETTASVVEQANCQLESSSSLSEDLPFPKLCSATEKELFAKANIKYLARQEFQRSGQMIDSDAVLLKWFSHAASVPLGLDISNLGGGLSKLTTQIKNFFTEYKTFRSFLQTLPTAR